ncbi:MAG: amino acid ABC transporter substrate-binding protein [Thermodesulfobacteriota bacterium]
MGNRIFLILIGILFFSLRISLAAGPEIKIGAVLSGSGKFIEPSEMMKNAYLLWEKQVNARGGLLGKPVKLTLYDDQSSEEQVKALYEKLIKQDKVDLILSPYGTTLTMAASEVTERYKYVMVAAAASGEKIWDRNFQYIAGVHALSDRYFIGFLDIIARNGFESVSILYEKSEFNISAARGAADWAKRFGLKISLHEGFSDPEKELKPLLSRVSAVDTQALIFCAYPQDCYRFIELMKTIGYRPRALAMTIAPALPNFPKVVGESAEGIFGPSQWEADSRLPFPGTVQFIKDFTEFSGKSPSYHAGDAFAACQILEKAVSETKTLNQKTLRDFVRSLDTVTVIGRFKVDYSGRQIGHEIILIQWQNGKKEILYPLHMKTANPKFGPIK